MSLEPFKIVGEVIALKKDEKGETVGEVSVGSITVYRRQFGELRELVEHDWPAVEAAHEQPPSRAARRAKPRKAAAKRRPKPR